jgi:hypothetical protein
MNPFPTSVSATSLVRPLAPPDPEKARKLGFRKFWFICVPLGAVLAVGLSILTQANIFFPCWAVCSVILWGASSAKEEKP